MELDLLPRYNELRLAEIPLQKSLSALIVAHALLHSEFVHFSSSKLGARTVAWIAEQQDAINFPLGPMYLNEFQISNSKAFPGYLKGNC